MSSTGGGVHHGIEVTTPDGSKVYVDVSTETLRQMLQAIRFVRPEKYAAIANALGDPVP